MEATAYIHGQVSGTISKIDVPEGVKTVAFGVDKEGSNRAGAKDKSIKLKREKKSFPDVETLIIGENIKEISIKNEMFPNVKDVVSRSRHFKDGAPFLVKLFPINAGKDRANEGILLNAFVKHDGEPVDISGITEIEKGAFAGCGAAAITGTESVRKCREGAFSQAILAKYMRADGICMVGNIFAGANTDDVIIPPEATCIAGGALPDGKVRRLDLSKAGKYAMWDFVGHKGDKFPLGIEELAIDPKDSFAENWVRNMFFNRYGENLESITLPESSQNFASINGMLFSKDKKELISCPKKKKKASVPDGTEAINSYAFYGVETEAIRLPASLKRIEKDAFVRMRIDEITLPEGIEYVGDGNFHFHTKAVHLPGGKPVEGLIGAVSWEGGVTYTGVPRIYCTYPCTVIDMGGEQFAVPTISTEGGMDGFKKEWDAGHFQRDLADVLFQAGAMPEIRQETALAALRLSPGNKEAKKFLKKEAKDIALRYIREDKDEELAGFLKCGFVDGKDCPDLIQAAKESGNGTAAAYILAMAKGAGEGAGALAL